MHAMREWTCIYIPGRGTKQCNVTLGDHKIIFKFFFILQNMRVTQTRNISSPKGNDRSPERASKKSHQNILIATEKKGNIDFLDIQGQLTP